jgi:RNA polymerase sigma-70 factor (ECF subfamily)
VTRSLPDPALFTRALQGGDEAMDALARGWLPHVYAWCHRLGGPGVDAEDCAHETLLVMCKGLARVQSAEVLPSWLFGVTRKVLANHRRRAWLRRWVPGASIDTARATDGGPEVSLQARQAAEVVWRALDRLPMDQREVLVLCELEERSGSEAAALVGVPLGTVKSRLRLAKVAFKRIVEELEGSVQRRAAAEVS